jgi:hypothetical protein
MEWILPGLVTNYDTLGFVVDGLVQPMLWVAPDSQLAVG